MKHIKPGRGPSMMGGIVGVIMIAFGVFWTVLASQLSVAMTIFGVLWTLFAAAQTVFLFKNATSQKRFSQYDITDDEEEPDPLQERFAASQGKPDSTAGESRFCPYCGAKAQEGFAFCNRCGKKLP